jgi:hypothetical protein
MGLSWGWWDMCVITNAIFGIKMDDRGMGSIRFQGSMSFCKV